MTEEAELRVGLIVDTPKGEIQAVIKPLGATFADAPPWWHGSVAARKNA